MKIFIHCFENLGINLDKEENCKCKYSESY